MITKLIQLEDGTLVQIEVSPDQAREISGGFADKVSATFDSIRPVLTKVCRPLAAAWQEINQDMNIEKAEIELGISFEGEGNIYITSSKASANLTVKLILNPKE